MKFSDDVEPSNTDRNNNFIDVFYYFLDKCFGLLLQVLEPLVEQPHVCLKLNVTLSKNLQFNQMKTLLFLQFQ